MNEERGESKGIRDEGELRGERRGKGKAMKMSKEHETELEVRDDGKKRGDWK